ncbi:MAG: histidine phosphatase family protein [Paenibacillus sp.]|nr:histidine phosphatase family protein [Paenibacillus sp.]
MENPNTIIYFVRHAQSAYVEGSERTRGLTEQGKRDAERVKDLLTGEQPDLFVSSPYRRAVDTILPLAQACGCEIRLEEDLRERALSGAEMGKDRFFDAKRTLFEQQDFAYPGGESSNEARRRASPVVADLLKRHTGKRIVIGTHGDIMTLMLQTYDPSCDFEFWQSTTMPDIYKLEFDMQGELIAKRRLWG